MHPVAERFLRYVTIDTQSQPVDKLPPGTPAPYPSTPSQAVFAQRLAEECKTIGLSDVKVDEYAYVTAALPSNINGDMPVIGLLAHMDTSSDAPGKDIKPRIVPHYDGSVIRLNEERVLSPEEFPHLRRYLGQDLIVTDGNTLLGADDKAGIAEILTAMEYLISHPELPHSKIRIAFTPDEEIGRGVDFFNVADFGADYAYTLDGGELGELEHESFNAARAVFQITGKSVHPGSAYRVMINAALIAGEIMNAFPPEETPAGTKDRDGFYHLTGVTGETSKASLNYILRDFDADGLERRKAFVTALAERFSTRYGSGTVSVQVRDEYRNMGEVLASRPETMARARRAIEKEGIVPIERPIRGGTDGSCLSFMGLPCPNIFTGGHNFHGPYEYIPIPSMEAAVRVIVNICGAETL